jgi:hypothetical protein
MTRTHRAAHRLLWPLLAVVLLTGLTMALALRPPAETPATPAQKGGHG